jgi:hypothetical protein
LLTTQLLLLVSESKKLKKNETQVQVAFFKGSRKSLLHRFIRWYTKSPYSHAELVMPDGETWVSISPFLSSKLETRSVKGDEDMDEWDFITFDLHWREPVKEYQLAQLDTFIKMTEGSGYDWTGMILSHVSSYVIKHKKKWYCSEWIAHALVYARIIHWDDVNLHRTPDLSPGKLYEILNTASQNTMYK